MTLLVWHVKLLFLDIGPEPPFIPAMRVRNGETSRRCPAGYLTNFTHEILAGLRG